MNSGNWWSWAVPVSERQAVCGHSMCVSRRFPAVHSHLEDEQVRCKVKQGPDAKLDCYRLKTVGDGKYRSHKGTFREICLETLREVTKPHDMYAR